MLTKGLARELAKYRVRVNAVNPGITKTGFQVRNKLMGADKYENFLNDISATYPLGIGQPEDVANAIVFLLSEESRWITGSLLIVDGGRIINS
jgi:NAD(P)-dependent dehydrogenase (short-subunit alcohol dehydrogenase family)